MADKLSTVPFDVLFEVVRYLDYGSVLSLSNTNWAFHKSVHPDALVPVEERRQFYLKAERFPHNAPYLACFTCWRLLPRENFGDGQRRGHCRKGSSYTGKSGYRFCWNCAAEKLLYQHQKATRKGKYLWYLCHHCHRFRHESRRCPAPEVLSDGTVVPRCAEDPAPTLSALESLPVAVRDRVLAHLGYRDLIRLAQASKHLRETVDPQRSPVTEKARFVQRQVLHLRQRGPGALGGRRGDTVHGCFACYTAKPESKFSRDQQQLAMGRGRRANFWLRRCQACLHALHGAGAGAPPTAPAGALAAWRARAFCGSCQLVRPAGEACPGCEDRRARALTGEAHRLREERKRLAEERAGGEDWGVVLGFVNWAEGNMFSDDDEAEEEEEKAWRLLGTSSRGGAAAAGSGSLPRVLTGLAAAAAGKKRPVPPPLSFAEQSLYRRMHERMHSHVAAPDAAPSSSATATAWRPSVLDQVATRLRRLLWRRHDRAGR